MTDESVKLVTSVLQALAAKLGVASEHLWMVLVKQAFISSISYLLFILVTVVLTVIWYRVTKTVHKYVTVGYKDPVYDGRIEHWDGEHYIYVVIGWVVVAICYIIVLADMSLMLGAFFNPEYWALNNVFSLISPGSCK